MKIIFTDSKFEKVANDDKKLAKKLAKKFGAIRAKKIRARLTQLEDAVTLEFLRMSVSSTSGWKLIV